MSSKTQSKLSYKVTVPPDEDLNREDMTSDTIVFNMCKYVEIESDCLTSRSGLTSDAEIFAYLRRTN